jgi:hypothetical protein
VTEADRDVPVSERGGWIDDRGLSAGEAYEEKTALDRLDVTFKLGTDCGFRRITAAVKVSVCD